MSFLCDSMTPIPDGGLRHIASENIRIDLVETASALTLSILQVAANKGTLYIDGV